MKKKKVLIDTNIVLDVLLERDDFFKQSYAVLKACEDNKVEGFFSASSMTDIFYVIRKATHDNEKAYEALGHLLSILNIMTVTNEDVINAYSKHAEDFEDCLVAMCARSNGCEVVVTRDKKGFEGLGITVISPKDFLKESLLFVSEKQHNQ